MFSFRQRPGKTAILFDNDPVLEMADEHLVFRQFRLGNLKLRPHGPVEIIELLPSCFYGPSLLRCEVRCRLRGRNEIAVTLTPCKVDRGLDRYVRERREITLRYVPRTGRFVCTVRVAADILQDITGAEGLALTAMPQWGSDRYAVVEFDDPLLSGGVGPQVPMTQDWTGLSEPWLAEKCFTTEWTKRFLSGTLCTSERGWRRIVFNRVVNGAQQFYNRHVLKTEPGAPYYYEKTDGRYVRYTPLFKHPSGHHICEWGYDMHLYALLPRAGEQALFRKGQRIRLAYEFEDVRASEVPAAVRRAPAAEIEPAEREQADLPIYQEPRCDFARSTLDCPDQYGFEARQPACAWNRKGGRRRGTGALEIDHGLRRGRSTWLFRHFGPSYACNPIPPLSRHRVAAWVRADEPEKVELALTLNTYAGPCPFSAITPVVSKGTAKHVVGREGRWALMEFITRPAGSYSISGLIEFRYAGKGRAAICDLSVTRL